MRTEISYERLVISSNIVGLVLAGQDTTSSAIIFVLKYLADFPHVYNEVLKATSSGPIMGLSSFR